MPRFLCIALILCGFHAFSQTAYPTGLTGCIARWNFTNSGTITSLPDVSGNGNGGSATNLVAANAFRIIPNKAIKFNGTSSYSQVPHASILTPSQMTIIALVNFDGFFSGTCQQSQIISKGYPYFISGNWGMGVGDNVYDGSCSVYSPNYMQQTNQFSSAPQTLTAGNYVQTGKWYFMATSYTGNVVKYYQKEMDTNTYYSVVSPIFTQSGLATAIGSNSQDVTIGKHLNPSFLYWFNGRMDEVVLFNRVLSDSEIQNVYHYLWGDIFVKTSDTLLCGTNKMTVNYTVLNPDHFYGSNVFTVQLSNSSGSFASPVNIGSVTSTSSGSIVCTIPAGTSYGNGYRIRVVASNSHFISGNNGVDIKYSASPFSINLGNDTNTCSNVPVTLSNHSTPPSGATYLWSTASTSSSIAATAAGSYWLKVTANGCSSTDTLNITNDPTPDIRLGNDTIICQGSNITLSNHGSTGSYSYLWNTSSSAPSINTATAGTYWLRAQLNTCSDTDTIVVAVQPLPLVNLGNDTTICSGNSLTLVNKAAGMPGSSYLWNTSATTSSVNATTAAAYWLKVTVNGCSTRDTINVSVDPTPNVNLGKDTTICQNSSVLLQNYGSSGTYSYLWNTGSTNATLTTATAGTYWLKAQYNACADTDTVVVTIQPLPLVSLGNDTTICDNASIQFKNTYTNPPGSTWLWNTGNTTSSINTSIPGLYWLRLTANKCSNADSVVLSLKPSPAINLGNDTSICGYDSITVSAHGLGAYTYTWNTGSNTPSINVKTPGAYYVTAAGNGCTSADTILVTARPKPDVYLGNDTIICKGNFLVLKNYVAFAGYSWLWYDGNSGAYDTVRKTGTYWLRGQYNSCYNTDTISVTVANPPVIDLGPDRLICKGDTARMMNWADNPVHGLYQWNTGDTTFSINVSDTGTYRLTITELGCSGWDSARVSFKPTPDVYIGNDTLLCSGDTITLHSNGQPQGSSYKWNTGSTADRLSVATQGQYILYVTYNGCTGSDAIMVNSISIPFVELGENARLCNGDTLYLPKDFKGYGYRFLWSDGSTDSSFKVYKEGKYTVRLSNICGVTSDSIQVEYHDCSLWFPSAFSPNGDGLNDFAKLIGDIAGISSCHLLIVNRWGQAVFSTNDVNQGWDGRFKGKEAEFGTYYYLIKATHRGKEVLLKGDITLIW